MSTTIDERVVSMKFDNKDFEKNVSTSLSTLDKLKQALSFKGASKGIEEVQSSINGIRLDALNQAIDTINSRFSNLGIIGMTALQNIANQAISTGKQMLESLTVDPIKDGFSEYELKMGSVQTILNSARDAEGNSVGLDVVNEKLEELNKYADNTIYSFSDMTASIGKFTNAGVDLDRAVKAIQGISNEAALSGANAEQASHAMYNFAQALSAGSVKLIDWKSIENANMATVEFKEELLKTAVNAGTLADNLDGTYTVLTENGQGKLMDDVISATSMFNDSLAYQWMTSDVLIETLGRYADELDPLGQRAFEAATEVKTFTDFMDSLKESIGSGWATTWEMIFGDYNESKRVWTEVSKIVGDFVNAQAEARNALLQEWNDMNGRAAVLDGIVWAYKTFLNITKAVSKAFREFFPAVTAEQITNLSFKFRGFMYNLELLTENSKGLKNTFRGIFAVLKILYNAIHTTLVLLEPLFATIIKAAWSLFSVIGTIGKLIAKNQSMISIFIDNALAMVLYNIVDVLSLIAGAIGFVVVGVAKLIATGIIPKLISLLPDLSGKLVSFSNVLRDFVVNIESKVIHAIQSLPKSLPELKDFVKGIGETLIHGIKNLPDLLPYLKNYISGLGPKLKEAFDTVIETIKTNIENIKAAIQGFDGVETGSINGFVTAVTVALSPLLAAFGVIHFIFSKLKDAIAFVYPYVVKYLPVIQSVIVDFATKIGHYIKNMGAEDIMNWMRSGTLVSFALSFRKIATSFSGIGEMFEAGKEALENLGGVLESYQKNLKANVLLKIAGAIAILAGSLIALSFIPAADLGKAAGAIGGLFVALAGSMKLIMKSLGGSEIKGVGDAVESFMNVQMIKALGTFMLELSGAVAIMSTCIIALSRIGGEDMTTALLGITAIEALLGAIAVIMTKMPKSENSIMALGVGLFFVALAVSQIASGVAALIEPLQTLGTMNREVLIQGGVAVASILLALAAAMALVSKVGIGSAGGLLAMTFAITQIVNLVSVLGEMDRDTLNQGLLSLVAICGALSVLGGVLGATEFGASAGVGIALIAVALEVLVDVLTKFGEMENVLKSLGILGAVLIELGIAMRIMNETAFGAGALILIAVALRILIPVLQALGDMEHPFKAILALAGVLLVLAGAAAIFTVLAPGLILLSVALVSLGAGMLMFSLALAAIAAIDVAAIIALAAPLGVALMELCTVIKGVTPTIIETLKFLIEQICALVDNVAPTIIETVINLIDTFFETLANHAESIVGSILKIILAILGGIKANIAQITYDLMDILINFIGGALTALIENMGPIILKVFDLVFAIIDGIATALGSEETADKLREAIINLGKSILQFFKNFFGINSPSTVFIELGGYLIDGLIEGIGGLIENAVGKIRELGERLIEGIKEKYDAFKEKGAGLIDKVHEGVDSVKDNLKTKFDEIIGGLKDFNLDDFITSGKNILNGLKAGLEDSETFNKLKDTTKSVFGAVRDTIARVFDENSPSKVTYEFGKYVDIGFANGIRDFAKTANVAASDFGESTLSTMNSAIGQITDLVENGIDADPTIRPVMDLSNVQSSIGNLNSMIGTSRSIDLAASANFGMNNLLAQNQNGVMVNNSDIVEAISNLQSDIINMGNAIRNLKIVLDSGTLVGGITERMDQSLGRLMIYNERGI